jgi:hypothetical protein
MVEFNYALASLGAVATASHTTAGYPASQAIDGSDVTQWLYDYGSSSVTMTLTVDLGAPQYIERVRTLLQAPQAQNCGLSYSTDGTNWNVIVAVVARANGEYSDPVDGITARYWRLTFTSGFAGSGGCKAFDVLGPVEAPPPPTSPAPTYIEAWLDGLEANYVPTIQDWLDAN